MSKVHYKFKSSLHYDSVTFDGQHISLGDLKKAIVIQKKFGKTMEMFRLQIINAQTNEEYKSDGELIARNTSIIVARIPIGSGSKPKSWLPPSMMPLPSTMKHEAAPVTLENLNKVSEKATTEDAKISAMIKQSGKTYDPSTYIKSRVPDGPPPSTYICYKCMKPGHWIYSCPGKNATADDLKAPAVVKRSTGIPNSYLTRVDGPQAGAVMTPEGYYAVPNMDLAAYKEGKKEKPPFVPGHVEPTPMAKPTRNIPSELICQLCNDIYKEAVVAPCCGNSYCDACIREILLEHEDQECPGCRKTDVSPDGLTANKFLRNAVKNYLYESGYKVKPKTNPIQDTGINTPPTMSPFNSLSNSLRNTPPSGRGSPLVPNEKIVLHLVTNSVIQQQPTVPPVVAMTKLTPVMSQVAQQLQTSAVTQQPIGQVVTQQPIGQVVTQQPIGQVVQTPVVNTVPTQQTVVQPQLIQPQTRVSDQQQQPPVSTLQQTPPVVNVSVAQPMPVSTTLTQQEQSVMKQESVPPIQPPEIVTSQPETVTVTSQSVTLTQPSVIQQTTTPVIATTVSAPAAAPTPLPGQALGLPDLSRPPPLVQTHAALPTQSQSMPNIPLHHNQTALVSQTQQTVGLVVPVPQPQQNVGAMLSAGMPVPQQTMMSNAGLTVSMPMQSGYPVIHQQQQMITARPMGQIVTNVPNSVPVPIQQPPQHRVHPLDQLSTNLHPLDQLAGGMFNNSTYTRPTMALPVYRPAIIPRYGPPQTIGPVYGSPMIRPAGVLMAPGPVPRHPQGPLSEEEFYKTKAKLLQDKLESVPRRKKDAIDDFLDHKHKQKKPPKKSKSRSKSRSYSRSKSRSRSRSPSPRSSHGRRSYSRSKTRSRSPRPRYRSRTPPKKKYSKSQSRSPRRYSKSRSRSLSRSRSRSRSKSFEPIRAPIRPLMKTRPFRRSPSPYRRRYNAFPPPYRSPPRVPYGPPAATRDYYPNPEDRYYDGVYYNEYYRQDRPGYPPPHDPYRDSMPYEGFYRDHPADSRGRSPPRPPAGWTKSRSRSPGKRRDEPSSLPRESRHSHSRSRSPKRRDKKQERDRSKEREKDKKVRSKESGKENKADSKGKKDSKKDTKADKKRSSKETKKGSDRDSKETKVKRDKRKDKKREKKGKSKDVEEESTSGHDSPAPGPGPAPMLSIMEDKAESDNDSPQPPVQSAKTLAQPDIPEPKQDKDSVVEECMKANGLIDDVSATPAATIATSAEEIEENKQLKDVKSIQLDSQLSLDPITTTTPSGEETKDSEKVKQKEQQKRKVKEVKPDKKKAKKARVDTSTVSDQKKKTKKATDILLPKMPAKDETTDKSKVVESPKKPELVVDMPELSKWEREDPGSASDSPLRSPPKKEVKKMLPRSVIERAQQALRSKSVRPVMSSKVNSTLGSKVNSTSGSSMAQVKTENMINPVKGDSKPARRVTLDDKSTVNSAPEKKHTEIKGSVPSEREMGGHGSPERAEGDLRQKLKEMKAKKEPLPRVKRVDSIFDESQFEPDYDEDGLDVKVEHDVFHEEAKVSVKEKPGKKKVTKQDSDEDSSENEGVRRRKRRKRSRSSSTSESESSSDSDTDSSYERRKHKRSKKSKHKKHKHKHKKEKKSHKHKKKHRR